MPDLHEALSNTVIGQASADGDQVVLVEHQDGRDVFRYSLHLTSNTFHFGGLNRAEFITWLGFESYDKCRFLGGYTTCFSIAATKTFDIDGFAQIIWTAFGDAAKAVRIFQDCGTDPKERRRIYPGGDGHRGSEQKRMEDSADDYFEYVMTWLVNGRNEGWVTHYRPKQMPVSPELERVINWLGLRESHECPEFAFESCFWSYLGYRGDRYGFDNNTDFAYGCFRKHAGEFSEGCRLVLDAEKQLTAFGMSFLPQSSPAAPARTLTTGRIEPGGELARQPTARPVHVQQQLIPDGGFDVAITFAGSERSYAERLATIIRDARYKVFYDQFYGAQLWGRDLAETFDSIYRKHARFCVMFISREYRDRMWTTHERRSALARQLEERGDIYILPVEVEKVDLEGLSPTLGGMPLDQYSIEEIAESLIAKLSGE